MYICLSICFAWLCTTFPLTGYRHFSILTHGGVKIRRNQNQIQNVLLYKYLNPFMYEFTIIYLQVFYQFMLKLGCKYDGIPVCPEVYP